MPRIHRAAWVLPIVTPPIRDGFVAVEDGRIVAVGESDRKRAELQFRLGRVRYDAA